MIYLLVLFNQLKYTIAVERMTFRNFEQQTSMMTSVPPPKTVCFLNFYSWTIADFGRDSIAI